MKRLFRGAWKLALAAAAAFTGITAALWLHSSFMIVDVTGNSMMPVLEPGQKAVVSLQGADSLQIGDLVVFQSPFYDVDGQGQFLIRQVTGIGGGQIETEGGSLAAFETGMIIDKEDILGKVVYYG